MSENKETFNYTYSATQQKEVETIRKKYTADATPTEVEKMEQLRRLDACVTGKATAVSLCVGIVSTLILGSGMSLIMTDFKEILGSYVGMSMIIGIIIGIVGMIGVIAAYPIYQSVLKRERKKAAPKILELIDELSHK